MGYDFRMVNRGEHTAGEADRNEYHHESTRLETGREEYGRRKHRCGDGPDGNLSTGFHSFGYSGSYLRKIESGEGREK